MADRYVWSGATGAANGTNWADAYTNLTAAFAASAAGDIVRVAHDHAETTAGAKTYTVPGTRTNPVRVLCVNRTSGLVSTGAEASTTGENFDLKVEASNSNGAVVIEGLKFVAGISATAGAHMQLGAASVYKSCTFETRAPTFPRIELLGVTTYKWKDCWVKAPSTPNSYIRMSAVSALEWSGGGVLAGHSGPYLIGQTAQMSKSVLENLDLSSHGNAAFAVWIGTTENQRGTIRDSKLPSGWTGSPHSGAVLANSRWSMYNCDAGDTNYRLWIQDYAGQIVNEAAIYRTDGAKVRNPSNALVGYSWKMTTNANTHAAVAPLYSDPIVRYYPGTGAEQVAFTPGESKTVTVQIAHSAAAALTDAQVWLEVDYLGTDGSPLGVCASDRAESLLATPTNQTTSAELWSGTAQTYRQQLSVTITPQAPGVISARVGLATGNNVVVYVDPVLTVS